MKKSKRQNVTLSQVMRGIKEYHIYRMAKEAKVTQQQWESFVTIIKNYDEAFQKIIDILGLNEYQHK